MRGSPKGRMWRLNTKTKLNYKSCTGSRIGANRYVNTVAENETVKNNTVMPHPAVTPPLNEALAYQSAPSPPLANHSLDAQQQNSLNMRWAFLSHRSPDAMQQANQQNSLNMRWLFLKNVSSLLYRI